MNVKQYIPKPARTMIWKTARFALPSIGLKHHLELKFWKQEWEKGGQQFVPHYEKLMLAIAGEKDDAFLANKIVADFGCGPKGSLTWIKQASKRIGIDVLVDQYKKKFRLQDHNMDYVCSTEKSIPLPDDHVDVMFTVNAIDHVENFEIMCTEVLRIMKPGCLFFGSFNLGEPLTGCEPQTLTEHKIEMHILNYLDVTFYQLAAQGPVEDDYKHFFDGSEPPKTGPRFLWVRGVKR